MDPDANPDQAAQDYSYDAVHDDLPFGRLGEPQAQPVTVSTETDDHDGDYSYDLAHDIPRPDA